MVCYDKSVLLFILFIVSINDVYAQEILHEERKRNLLNSIKPTISIDDPNLKNQKIRLDVETEGKVVNKDNIAQKVLQHRDGGARFDDKYSIDSLKSSMSKFDLFKMEGIRDYKIIISNGKTYVIKKDETDFRLDNLSQKQRLRGAPMIETTMGGLNLSGFKEKKSMSTKTKYILKDILGVEIDE